MDVKVLAKRFGNYVEGDVITNMPEATANALAKNKLVEVVGEETEVKHKKTTKKIVKRLTLLIALFVGMASFASAQDYSGLVKTVTLTNAQVDSTVVNISGSRSAITFKYDITKTSGTVAGTIALQYKVTTLGSERWFTYNTYTLTDASAINVIELPKNPALKWKILATTTGTSVSTHRYYLLYRK